MSRLEVEDVDLAKGTIRIRNNVKLNERTPPLAAYQVPYLYEYINNIRPKLLKQSDHAKGDRLFFTYANGQTVNETIKKLLIEGLIITMLHQIADEIGETKEEKVAGHSRTKAETGKWIKMLDHGN